MTDQGKRIAVKAHAIVTVTVRIPLESTWGPDCTVGQINRQAADEGIQALRKGLVIGGLRSAGSKGARPAEIIGELVVEKVLLPAATVRGRPSEA